MQGLYKFYSDGVLIGETRNLLTTQGKNRIRQILAGKTNGFASSISVGIGSTTPSVDDLSLEFAIDSANILNTMVDDPNNKIFFKTSLPADKQYKIYELGCYAASSTTAKQLQQSSLLLTFGELTSWSDTSGTHSLNSTNTRVGASSIRYSLSSSGVGTGSTPFQISLDQLPTNTSFKIGYFANNIDNIKLRFKTTDSDYYQGTLTPATNNSYNISSIVKSAFVATGSPSWSTITNIEIESTATTSAGVIDLDALRYDVEVSGESILLSRALASSPILKPAGSTMDVEYLLEGIA